MMKMILPILQRRITISIPKLKLLALYSLFVPVLLFNSLFLRWYIGVSCDACLLAALFLYRGGLMEGQKKTESDMKETKLFSPTLGTLLCCLLMAAGWTLLSGIGGYFTQSADFNNRNAILHDLLDHSWPVYFEGTGSALTYYLGYWIVPALLGKGMGLLFGAPSAWSAACFLLYLQTVWLLLLAFLLLLSFCGRSARAGRVLLVFLLFSGMDGLMCFLHSDWSPHIEWWAETWQYSSMTTDLFWVFNQAVPAWLVTMLFLHSVQDLHAYALIGLSCALFAPFPLAGIAVLCLGCFLWTLIRGKTRHGVWRRVFGPVNLLSALSMIPILLYLTSNHAVGGDPFHLELFREHYPTIGRYLYKFLQFHLVEWGVFALLIFPEYRKKPIFLMACFSLALIPLFKMGENYNDFVMRVSIPGLAILCAYCIRFLSQPREKQSRFRAFLLIAALAIGSLTPLTEVKRSVDGYLANGAPVIEDHYGTVLNAVGDTVDTPYFLCTDISESLFYRYLAKPE